MISNHAHELKDQSTSTQRSISQEVLIQTSNLQQIKKWRLILAFIC